MSARSILAALGLAGAALLTSPAHAEKLLLALSSQQVTIASNYAGGELTLFGAVRGETRQAGGRFEAVVRARGPGRTLQVRRKERIGPFWINGPARTFERAPDFLAVLSSRPLGTVVGADDIASEQLSLSAAADGAPAGGTRRVDVTEDAAFVAALVRRQAERGHWREDGRGVAFLDRDVFRASIHLPPDVAFGAYEVEARIYDQGRLAALETITFRVVKAGFEQRVARFADRERLLYGFGMALLAIAFGWTASAAFRRD
ncbi:TIGR02186 family protein [Methylopila musalis]|uniref:TIGR02186 family protein n=1 Tax=Methylopila musalis TaxID=1134781 RepID=A0ABW3ZBK0_9HYPH